MEEGESMEKVKYSVFGTTVQLPIYQRTARTANSVRRPLLNKQHFTTAYIDDGICLISSLVLVMTQILNEVVRRADEATCCTRGRRGSATSDFSESLASLLTVKPWLLS